MTISRFVAAGTLEDEDDMRLALSEAEQRDLLNRVNRTLLFLEDLMAPLPGSSRPGAKPEARGQRQDEAARPGDGRHALGLVRPSRAGTHPSL